MAYLEDVGVKGSIYSTEDTGRTLANSVPERVEYFDPGFQGHGFKLWKDEDGKYKIEVDDMTIRNSITAFELIISQIRAVRGSMAITQGSAKVKNVSVIGADYVLEIEDDINTIVEYDFVRCQRANRMYHVEVSKVDQNYIYIPISEFESGDDGIVINPPNPGDEIVQFGNASRLEKYNKRHSAIYLSIDNEEPAIDLMTDIYSKNWDTSLKVRIGGNLPGTEGERGFYSVNGKIIAVDEEGESIYEINPDGSGFFARGKFSWTASGSPAFSGTILLETTNGGVWKVNEEGENTIGVVDGQRIVLSPTSCDIKIYDSEGNNVTTIGGVNNKSIDYLFPNDSPTINIKNIPLFIGKDLRKDVKITDSFQTTGICLVKTSITGGFYSPTRSIIGYSVIADTYSDPDLTLLAKTTILAGAGFTGVEHTISRKENVMLGEGYHVLRCNISINKELPDGGVFSINSISVEVILNSYMSSYFSNGLVLGSSSNNCVAFLNEIKEGVNYMSALIENPNGGFMIDRFNTKIKTSGFWWTPRAVVASGRIFSNVSGANISRMKTYNNKLPTLKRSSIGRINFKFDTTWVADGITPPNCQFQITGVGYGVGTQSITFASIVTFVNDNSVEIAITNHEGSSVDGDLFIDVTI